MEELRASFALPFFLVFDFGTARATSSFPVPVSPVMSTAKSVGPPSTPARLRHYAEKNGGTIVTLAQNVSDALAKRTGAHPSWIQMLDRLDEILAQRSPEPQHG